MTSLISGLTEAEVRNMTLGLAHGLSRYKLKFSIEKVDTMIIQAISLLDDLDKEVNNYMDETTGNGMDGISLSSLRSSLTIKSTPRLLR